MPTVKKNSKSKTKGKTPSPKVSPKKRAQRKYEEDIGAYLHLEIEERTPKETELTKAFVPETIRRKSFWKRLRIRRKYLARKTLAFVTDWRKMVAFWVVILSIIAIGAYFKWDQEITSGVVVIIGIISGAFSWMFAGVLTGAAAVPLIGPYLAAALSSSLIWILNALGYFVSIVAIKRGHKKVVLNYRLLVVVFLTGIVVGYVAGRVVN